MLFERGLYFHLSSIRRAGRAKGVLGMSLGSVFLGRDLFRVDEREPIQKIRGMANLKFQQICVDCLANLQPSLANMT